MAKSTKPMRYTLIMPHVEIVPNATRPPNPQGVAQCPECWQSRVRVTKTDQKAGMRHYRCAYCGTREDDGSYKATTFKLPIPEPSETKGETEAPAGGQ